MQHGLCGEFVQQFRQVPKSAEAKCESFSNFENLVHIQETLNRQSKINTQCHLRNAKWIQTVYLSLWSTPTIFMCIIYIYILYTPQGVLEREKIIQRIRNTANLSTLFHSNRIISTAKPYSTHYISLLLIACHIIRNTREMNVSSFFSSFFSA